MGTSVINSPLSYLALINISLYLYVTLAIFFICILLNLRASLIMDFVFFFFLVKFNYLNLDIL